MEKIVPKLKTNAVCNSLPGKKEVAVFLVHVLKTETKFLCGNCKKCICLQHAPPQFKI